MGSALKRECIYLKKNNVFVNPLFLLAKEVSFWHHGYILHKVPDIRSEEQKNVHK